MNLAEMLLGGLLAATLVVVALYFAGRQVRTLRTLSVEPTLGVEERSYLRGQVRRRLLCSMLMVLFAGFLVGWFFIARNIPQPAAGEEEAGRDGAFVRLVAYYWITALLVLFGILVLAALDFFATARHGMHQKKLLNLEHRANLELDAARIRKQRQRDNGLDDTKH